MKNGPSEEGPYDPVGTEITDDCQSRAQTIDERFHERYARKEYSRGNRRADDSGDVRTHGIMSRKFC